MITQILIKQEQKQGKNFYLHAKGDCKFTENFSTFAFEAFTTAQIKEEVSKIIKEHGMSEKYTIGVTVSEKIQITLKKQFDMRCYFLQNGTNKGNNMLDDMKGDTVSVRPLGSVYTTQGTFESVDRNSGKITIKLDSGELKTITYGNFFNYSLRDRVNQK